MTDKEEVLVAKMQSLLTISSKFLNNSFFIFISSLTASIIKLQFLNSSMLFTLTSLFNALLYTFLSILFFSNKRLSIFFIKSIALIDASLAAS